MPRDPPVVYLYPLTNYQQGSKGPLLEKDSSVKERMLRMADLYKKFGMRRVVEGLLLAHEHSHPHVLLLQIGNTYFKLPGGRLRVGEHETDGLRRKLTNKLGTPQPDSTVNWQIGELVSTWWRPNFETVMYPYIPPQVAGPKECRKIFLTQLPPTGILGVPKNLKLLAVPLFELYDNAHRYGPVIASLPQLLARVKFVFCDHNAQPLMNQHIKAYQMTNMQIYNKIQKAKKNKAIHVKQENSNTALMNLDMRLDIDTKEDIVMNKAEDTVNALMNTDSALSEANNGNVLNINNLNNQNVLNALNVNKMNLNNSGLGLNPLLNFRTGLMNNIYAQNILQRQLMAQQIMAQNMLRMSSSSLRAPNARLILTPTLQSPQANPISNPLMFQQMLAQQQQQQMLPQAIQPPQSNANPAPTSQAQTTNANVANSQPASS